MQENVDINQINALIAALQRQRDDALNKLAQAEAKGMLLEAKLTELFNKEKEEVERGDREEKKKNRKPK